MNRARPDLPAVPLVRTDGAEPTLADRYELRSVLGSGGMGTVWEAYDNRLHRNVALKIIRDDLPPSAAAQLEREARAAARIRDPRVVTVLDLDRTPDGNPYLVLECHDGHTLADELRDGPLSPERLDRLVEDLLGALGAAHRCSVLHRDVKPANVLSGDDGFRVTDFGLASLDDDQSTETDLMGTLVYVAPERLDGARGSARSDVFSAAVVLYEAASGVQPFRRDQPVESIAALRTGAAPPLPDSLPAAFRETLRRALDPDPEQRPEDAAAMLAQIRSAPAAPAPGPDPTIRLDATSVLPLVDAHERTVPVPEVPAPEVPAPEIEDPPASTTVTDAVEELAPPADVATVQVPHQPSPAAPEQRPEPEHHLVPDLDAERAPRSPGPFDDARRFVARHGRRPEVLIGLIAALLLLLLLAVVAMDRNVDAPATVDAGQEAPASLDETLDRIAELGR